MTTADAGTVAVRCLEAWTSGDFSTARSLLRADVTVDGPSGSAEGADDYLAGLEDLARTVTGVERKRVVVDGDDVCIFYDLMTTGTGPLPATDRFHVHDGQIDAVTASFDPRVLARSDDRGRRTDRPAAVPFPVFCSAEMEIAAGGVIP